MILAIWQMPHFYAIAMYRDEDYKAAGLPVLPVAKGMQVAKRQALAYIIAFIPVTALLFFYGYTGWIYLLAVLALGFYWLWTATYKTKGLGYDAWGKKVFIASLYISMVLSVVIATGALLP